MNAEANRDHVPGMICLACCNITTEFTAAVYWTDGQRASVEFESARDAYSFRRLVGDAHLLTEPMPNEPVQWYADIAVARKSLDARRDKSGRARANPFRCQTYYHREDLLAAVPQKRVRELKRRALVGGVEYVAVDAKAVRRLADAAGVRKLDLPNSARLA